MKKRFILFILLVLFPIMVNAKEKVNVYVFEAGGCPYCEMEVEYLKGLDGYGETFDIIQKELYIDHIDWEKGKDYDLGVKVANAFNKAGYEDASYQGTPFVVIADVYAATLYSEDLENIINEAYENEYKDAVKCFEDGKDNCIDHVMNTDYSNKTNNSNSTTKAEVIAIILCSIVIILVYVIKSSIDRKIILDQIKNKRK